MEGKFTFFVYNVAMNLLYHHSAGYVITNHSGFVLGHGHSATKVTIALFCRSHYDNFDVIVIVALLSHNWRKESSHDYNYKGIKNDDRWIFVCLMKGSKKSVGST